MSASSALHAVCVNALSEACAPRREAIRRDGRARWRKRGLRICAKYEVLEVQKNWRARALAWRSRARACGRARGQCALQRARENRTRMQCGCACVTFI